jgi:hypothetical protein
MTITIGLNLTITLPCNFIVSILFAIAVGAFCEVVILFKIWTAERELHRTPQAADLAVENIELVLASQVDTVDVYSIQDTPGALYAAATLVDDVVNSKGHRKECDWSW